MLRMKYQYRIHFTVEGAPKRHRSFLQYTPPSLKAPTIGIYSAATAKSYMILMWMRCGYQSVLLVIDATRKLHALAVGRPAMTYA